MGIISKRHFAKPKRGVYSRGFGTVVEDRPFAVGEVVNPAVEQVKQMQEQVGSGAKGGKRGRKPNVGINISKRLKDMTLGNGLLEERPTLN